MFKAADSKTSFLGSISPWNISRNATPPPPPPQVEKEAVTETDALQKSQGDDHAVTRRPRLSLRDYPRDCPPLRTRWFYAVDIPKRKPKLQSLGEGKEIEKPKAVPRKYVPFTARDSQALETAFQNLAEKEAATGRFDTAQTSETKKQSSTRVPVNEDYLFDVDLEERELLPAYWLGPVYNVRRGTWFFQEGSILKPCEENLATQLEEGYLKSKPWRLTATPSTPRTPRPAGQNTLEKSAASSKVSTPILSPTGVPENENASDTGDGDLPSGPGITSASHRLFGSYMNTTVTYQDAAVAWLNADNFMSRMSSTVYSRLGTASGTKVVRGYSETKKSKEDKVNEGRATEEKADDKSIPNASLTAKKLKRQSAPAGTLVTDLPNEENRDSSDSSRMEPKQTPLERHISSLTGETGEAESLEEAARRQEEKEMEESREADDEERDRPIDHLILVTHGIGQRLGLRLESLNFIHDVNSLRKTLKQVYGASPDLQALNLQVNELPKNCRIQVLPVCWRHRLNFPDLKQNRKELDLTDADLFASDEQAYPSLEDITVEGVPAVRNLITDLAMDVLLYQSAYREHISKIVQEECNRLYHLFKERNPTFDGRVSLCGHSLGSAIIFDILCRQPDDSTTYHRHAAKVGGSRLLLDFECENFFALGSPIALFQMLKGRTIAARHGEDAEPAQSPFDSTIDDPFPTLGKHNIEDVADHKISLGNLAQTVSSPKCREFYNVFHPTDPIAYRIEPLISQSMATLKPQPLPYVKRGLWGSGQGLTNIGALVGQSVGSIWTNFTSGVANSLLNRSLGLQPDVAVPQQADSSKKGITSVQRNQAQDGNLYSEEAKKQLALQIKTSEEQGQAPPTLIDSEMETLFEGFQKQRQTHQNELEGEEKSEAWLENENRSRKLRREEAKVRALNSNGRVDYSIQESFFDISLIASIASHLSYWADEDVNHFMLSQILSKDRKHRRN